MYRGWRRRSSPGMSQIAWVYTFVHWKRGNGGDSRGGTCHVEMLNSSFCGVSKLRCQLPVQTTKGRRGKRNGGNRPSFLAKCLERCLDDVQTANGIGRHTYFWVILHTRTIPWIVESFGSNNNVPRLMFTRPIPAQENRFFSNISLYGREESWYKDFYAVKCSRGLPDLPVTILLQSFVRSSSCLLKSSPINFVCYAKNIEQKINKTRKPFLYIPHTKLSSLA